MSLGRDTAHLAVIIHAEFLRMRAPTHLPPTLSVVPKTVRLVAPISRRDYSRRSFTHHNVSGTIPSHASFDASSAASHSAPNDSLDTFVIF